MPMTPHGATEGGDGGREVLSPVKRIPIVVDGENLGGRVRRGFFKIWIWEWADHRNLKIAMAMMMMMTRNQRQRNISLSLLLTTSQGIVTVHGTRRMVPILLAPAALGGMERKYR
jgi:hypothetical protein